MIRPSTSLVLRNTGCWVLCTVLAAGPAAGADLKILWPQGRDAFQTNEVIDVSVVRSAAERLNAGDLVLTLAGADASRLGFVFPVAAAEPAGGTARRTEHLHLNGWLLRPGKYTLEVAADGAAAKAEIEVFSHVRQSDFRLVNWGRATGDGQRIQGEDSLGFNLMYMAYGKEENANYIRAGVDFMANCVMSGGHQMDLRQRLRLVRSVRHPRRHDAGRRGGP